MLAVPVIDWVLPGDRWPVPFADVVAVLARAGVPLTNAALKASQQAGAWAFDSCAGEMFTAAAVQNTLRTNHAYDKVAKIGRAHG